MYEGALPTTGAGLSVAGTMIGLSWLIAVGVAVILGGVLLTRVTKRKATR